MVPPARFQRATFRLGDKGLLFSWVSSSFPIVELSASNQHKSLISVLSYSPKLLNVTIQGGRTGGRTGEEIKMARHRTGSVKVEKGGFHARIVYVDRDGLSRQMKRRAPSRRQAEKLLTGLCDISRRRASRIPKARYWLRGIPSGPGSLMLARMESEAEEASRG
jgi:hypothetical protein